MKKEPSVFLVLLTTFSLFLSFYWFPSLSVAETKGNNQSVAFTVKALLPENQLTPENSYFDLEVTPNISQEIQLELHNNTNEEITVENKFHLAKTNRNGLIEYSDRSGLESYRLEQTITKLVEIPKESQDVVIPPYQNRFVSIYIKIPDNHFQGVLLGGIESQLKNSKQDEAQLTNNFSYITALMLSEKKYVSANLNLLRAKADLVNDYRSINIKIANTTPAIANNVTIHATLTKKNQTEVLKKSQLKSATFAPNSVMDFQIPWGNTDMKSGKYTVHTTAKSADNSWSWSTDFDIKKEEAKKLNANAIDRFVLPKLWVILFASCSLSVGILLIVLNKRNRRRKAG